MPGEVKRRRIPEHVPTAADQFRATNPWLVLMRFHGGGGHYQDIDLLQCLVIRGAQCRAPVLRLGVEAAMIVLLEVGPQEQGELERGREIVGLRAAELSERTRQTRVVQPAQ